MAEEYKGGMKGHLLFTLGILAIVYGLISYFESIGWPTYLSWIVGGIVLVLVAWAKKAMWMKK